MNRKQSLKIGLKILNILYVKSNDSQKDALSLCGQLNFNRELLQFAGLHSKYSYAEIKAAKNNLDRSARVNFCASGKRAKDHSQIWHYLCEVEYQLWAHNNCYDTNFDYEKFHLLEGKK